MSGINEVWVENQPIAQRFRKYPPLVPVRETGGVVYISGHGPEDRNTYRPLYTGRVGDELTLEEGYAAARECANTIFCDIRERYGTLDCIDHMVRALALVNCGEGFDQPEKVADGFSDFCVEVLEGRGQHARTVMGTHNMPNHQIPVEIEVIFVLKDAYCNKGEMTRDGTV